MVKRRKRKIISTVIGILGVIIAALFLIYILGIKQTIISQSVEYTSTSVTDKDSYYEWRFDWVTNQARSLTRNPSTGVCTVSEGISTIGSPVPWVPLDEQWAKLLPPGTYYFNISFVGIEEIGGPINVVKNLTASFCIIETVARTKGVKGVEAFMSCHFNGEFLCPPFGNREWEYQTKPDGYAIVKVPKTTSISTNITDQTIIESVPPNLTVNDQNQVQCIDNVGCIEICGDKTPTCVDNLCRCDNKIVVVQKLQPSTKLPTIILLSMVGVIIIIISIVLIGRKRR